MPTEYEVFELNEHEITLSNPPDELRVDIDPMPDAPWDHVRRVALLAGEVLREHGLAGFPRTSGSRGMHIMVRIHAQWDFTIVRAAALALAREVERRAEGMATSKWWKEERPADAVFVDYNQNAKDHTTAAGYSVRPTDDARVSTPLTWDEVPDCDPTRYTMDSVPGRDDPWNGVDESAGSLETLLELAAEHKKRAASPRKAAKGTGRRQPSMPLIEIARAATKDEALEGLERWKARHPAVWPYLEPADVLVDSMRGRNTLWTRIRLNLRHVPEDQRPPQEPLEVEYDPWAGVSWTGRNPP